MANLSDRQRMFCIEYLMDLNATQAAIRAGYAPKSAARQGWRLMGMPRVKAEIEKLMNERAEKASITVQEILEQLAVIACADAADFVEVTVREGVDKSGNPIEVRQVEIKPTSEVESKKQGALAGIKQNTSGIEVKVYDKLKALELLMRHMGMLREKTGHSGKMEVTVELAGVLREWGK